MLYMARRRTNGEIFRSIAMKHLKEIAVVAIIRNDFPGMEKSKDALQGLK